MMNSSLSEVVIPGWSDGPDPESRDSGFDASHRPGMTEAKLSEAAAPLQRRSLAVASRYFLL
jgi:hypothetical protein